MTYSKYFFPQNPKIPTTLTIGVVLLLIFFLLRLFGSTATPSRGSKKIVKQIRVVNPTHNQFGIFWQTDEKETGWLIYGKREQSLNDVALDERDLQDKRNLYYNHLVVIKNLEPETEYFYKIVSNNQLIESPASGAKPFSFKTSANILQVANLGPAYGKIVKGNGEFLSDAIVILSIDKAYPIASITKTTGEWLIPLNLVINKDTRKNQKVDSNQKLTIEIFAEEKKKTNIITDVSHVGPLPQTVIFGKNYNFLNEEDVLSISTETKKPRDKIEILFPKEDAIISGGTPLIKGTAIPGYEVIVTIESVKSYTLKTLADKEGIWRVILTEQLSPGSHLLKIETKDTSGKKVLLTRKFAIAKSGEQVLASATAEATPTLAPTLTPTPSTTPTLVIQTPTDTPTPPVPGSNIIPIGITSASLIILGLGIFLVF
ncbi:hypothetical protein A3C98_04330 [Candidatus Roizmanbacteria bacterium RIFCSPHIGHO2_02_FULL_37_15]|uniref:Purple acid phosphatase N-terminal domain-containing protein n=1 Tax=Candidatus Roizmanbacteria bacterium RIFCSPLOWO2_01_FULL_37_16 TaxID=1802058 RepID=A0A1F7IIN6_9BACT|nr:MAG: hypothetical protein A3C98_04330 [Candidatus Roizmanbacteria bacterium RIFCSPHIGHO2_02_FULL_37_15]OGK33310.1 MAG: hypothetical protein A3F57_05210 [Candidatus Roizmanbacteria bacterium RIFCSPHIGHO2_12_FULL_36_11]OGK43226.1 MAG: hypothetical protein A3B40_03105 [Candidatus Roizmanbacteria bacterium RIFCSPLOWO2_01_FULL_37_16]OGK56827.1 MAG: hypothetical protein A3I50_00615 [Candidatus Roizmanbacteria bacterium RIFCSPLOWO2_02_FULL_37_9]